MVSFIKRSFSWLITGSCSIVFAACYGPPVGLENPKQINAKNNENMAIPGLKVTLYENRKAIEEQFTDEKGTVEFYVSQKDKYQYLAIIEDVDGNENLGLFKSKELDITNNSILDINLEYQE
jgi:hypothetical protein